jgi:hypothetical protein
MHEIAPGICHWTAVHPNLGIEVSAYWLPELGVLLDPIAIPDEVDEIDEIVLSNRHHRRDALPARERFGATIHAPRVGMHEFGEETPIEPYEFGEPLVGGAITAHQVTDLWADDGVLHIPSLNALAIADTVMRNGEDLHFMPDECFDDREAEQRAIRAGLARLARELDFEHLLLAHGTPIARDGRRQLLEWAEKA